MPDLQAIQEKVGRPQEGGERFDQIEDQIMQISNQLEVQKVLIKNTQLNVTADINQRFGAIEEKIESMNSNGDDEEIQQKLVE